MAPHQRTRRSLRRRGSREETMQKLVHSGLDVFSRHGFDGASTKMVAEHADVNEALISRYFGGKEGLLRAIILQSARDANTQATEYPAGNTVEQEIVNFLTAAIDAFGRNPAFLRLLLSRTIISPTRQRSLMKELTRVGEIHLIGRLAEFQAREVISSSVNLRDVSEILQLFIVGMLLKRLLWGSSRVHVTRTIAQMANAIAQTVLQ